MRKDLKGGESGVRGIVARFFTALRFVLNDDEEGFEIDNPSVCVADRSRAKQGELCPRSPQTRNLCVCSSRP